jgi:membrane protein DedA with SNARE-associated domain
LSKLLNALSDHLGRLVHHSYSIADRMSTKQRWMLGTLVVVAMAGMCYGIFRFSSHLEGFKQYGVLGAFLASFIASTSIFLPVPAFFVIGAIAASPDSNWAMVAVASTAGGALGQFTSYLAGYGGRVVINKEKSAWYRRAEGWMNRHGTMTVFAFALTFMPVDAVGIVAGALRFPFWKYVLAIFFGYLPKTLIGCYLAHRGYQILPSLRQTLGSMPWWVWALVGVAVVLAVVLGVLIWRRQRKAKIQGDQQVQS